MLVPFSSLSNLQVGLMRVLNALLDSIPNFFMISLIYLVWFMNIPSFSYLICNSRKKVSSSIIRISIFSCINLVNSSHNECLVAPKIMSSTYIYTTNNFLSFFFKNNVVSIFSLLNLFLIRKLLSLSYHALGVCFKP